MHMFNQCIKSEEAEIRSVSSAATLVVRPELRMPGRPGHLQWTLVAQLTFRQKILWWHVYQLRIIKTTRPRDFM